MTKAVVFAYLVAVVAIFGGGESVHAAVVLLGPPQSSNGFAVIQVTLDGSAYDAVSGLQFDLDFDDSAFVLEDIVLGDAAADADKDAMFTDAFRDTIRVLVTGMNQNVIEDGVVATLYFTALDPNADPSGISLHSTLLSDPFGNAIDPGAGPEDPGAGPPESQTTDAEVVGEPAVIASIVLQESEVLSGDGGPAEEGEVFRSFRDPVAAGLSTGAPDGETRSAAPDEGASAQRASAATGGEIRRYSKRPRDTPSARVRLTGDAWRKSKRGKTGSQDFAEIHSPDAGQEEIPGAVVPFVVASAAQVPLTAANPSGSVALGAADEVLRRSMEAARRENKPWFLALVTGVAVLFIILGLRQVAFARLDARRRRALKNGRP